MNEQTRIQLLKILGGFMIAFAVLIIIADFADSELTFRAFFHAFKAGALYLVLGAFFLSQAGYSERIRQLEKENAALRAAQNEVPLPSTKRDP